MNNANCNNDSIRLFVKARLWYLTLQRWGPTNQPSTFLPPLFLPPHSFISLDWKLYKYDTELFVHWYFYIHIYINLCLDSHVICDSAFPSSVVSDINALSACVYLIDNTTLLAATQTRSPRFLIFKIKKKKRSWITVMDVAGELPPPHHNHHHTLLTNTLLPPSLFTLPSSSSS